MFQYKKWNWIKYCTWVVLSVEKITCQYLSTVGLKLGDLWGYFYGPSMPIRRPSNTLEIDTETISAEGDAFIKTK